MSGSGSDDEPRASTPTLTGHASNARNAWRSSCGDVMPHPHVGPKFWLIKVVTPIECLHYALSLPTSVVITGIDSMKILEQAFEAVRTFKPLTRPQISALLAKTSKAASNGEYELFKTTSNFDSTAHNPKWLG